MILLPAFHHRKLSQHSLLVSLDYIVTSFLSSVLRSRSLFAQRNLEMASASNEAANTRMRLLKAVAILALIALMVTGGSTGD